MSRLKSCFNTDVTTFGHFKIHVLIEIANFSCIICQ